MPTARRLRLPVPVNIITGSLASGKTTFIGALLRQKPQEEVWAVLVNEFGAAGLDAALLEGSRGAGPAAAGDAAEGGMGDAGGNGSGSGSAAGSSGAAGNGSLEGIHIKQLAGGCLCCALSNVTALAIAQLLRSVKPDRLIIEPSGLAHPSALVDMLQGEHLGPSLALQPVVCLVDATQFSGGATSPACCNVPLLADQISIADALVGSKADLCDEAALAAFHTWAEQLFPPKSLVATAWQGQLDSSTAGTAGVAALLSWPQQAGSRDAKGAASGVAAAQPEAGSGLPVRRPRQGTASQPWLSSSGGSSGSSWKGSPAAAEEVAARDRPLRKQVQDSSGAHAACGWIFHRDCIFDKSRLQALLRLLEPRTLRLKGVFRVSSKTWVAISAAPAAAAAASLADAAPSSQPAAAQLSEIAYRRDSRAEVIIDVAAAASSSCPAVPDVSLTAGCLEQQAAQLGLEEGGGMERQVAAALRQAAAGDWGGLEALLQQTLAS